MSSRCIFLKMFMDLLDEKNKQRTVRHVLFLIISSQRVPALQYRLCSDFQWLSQSLDGPVLRLLTALDHHWSVPWQGFQQHLPICDPHITAFTIIGRSGPQVFNRTWPICDPHGEIAGRPKFKTTAEDQDFASHACLPEIACMDLNFAREDV